MIELYNGDCLEIMRNIADNSIDLIVTDPPYGVDFQSNRRKVKFDKIHNDDNLYFLDDCNEQLHRVMKNDSHIYMFCAFKTIDVFKQSFEKYFTLKNIIIWNKNNFGTGNFYRYKYEMILFGIKGDKKIKSKSIADVVNFNGTGNKLHPTQKSVNLLKLFIEQSSDENDTVLDCFMGSGSTGVACKNTNRNFIGIELKYDYFKIAKERIENGFYQEDCDNFETNGVGLL